MNFSVFGNDTSGANNFQEPLCQKFTQDSFDPHCLPAAMKNYTFLSGIGKGKEPFVYNTWMFAEACGVQMTAWRAINQLPRRRVLFKAAESILMNWGVYAAGTIVASIFMNCFYIAPKRRRCCGIFPELNDPRQATGGFSYQNLNSCMYTFIMFPVSIMVLSGCLYQLVSELMAYHREIDTLQTAVCYKVQNAENILNPIPSSTCKDIMRLDWPCHQSMTMILMLAIFSIMDCLLILAISCYMSFLVMLSYLRVLCCCCGCRLFGALHNRPDTLCGMCGPNFNCSMCCCWGLCHPSAFCCVNMVLIPIVVTLYFYAGLIACLAAYGVILLVIIGIIFLAELCCRFSIKIVSCGRCLPLDIPKSWYFRTLLPLPGHYPGHAISASHLQQRRMKEQLYDEMAGGGEHARFDPDMAADDEGFEGEIIGTPCPALMMAVSPSPLLIIIVPIGLIAIISCSCFLWEDYLTRVVAWKNADMAWYMSDSAMGPGYRAWPWWIQVFMELIYGLTDAWVGLFEAWWFFVSNIFTMKKQFGDAVTSFFMHGSNPLNLFRQSFDKFVMAALFWRFILAAVFTIIRTTALINLPMSAIKPDEEYHSSKDAYDEVEAMDVDAYDPYRGY